MMQIGTWRFKKIALTVALASSLAVVPPVHAGSQGSGLILAGHPGTAILLGVTERDFRDTGCTTLPPNHQGKDGFVFALPDGTTSLNLTAETALSKAGVPGSFGIHVFFYKAGSPCDTLAPYYNANPLRTSWSGSVPSGSKWVVVGANHGSNIKLNWSTAP